jgi:hypothetical protein
VLDASSEQVERIGMSRNRQTLSGQRSRVLTFAVAGASALALAACGTTAATGHSTTDPPTTATPATSPPTTNPPTGGGSGNQVTAAESNLQTAFTGAKTYFEAANQTYAGVLNSTTYSNITTLDTGLTFVPGSKTSTGVSNISIRDFGSGVAMEITAYAPSSGVCYGILDVTAALDAPPFSQYSGTAAVGTYYFSSQQPNAGECKAGVTSADALSGNGWSTSSSPTTTSPPTTTTPPNTTTPAEAAPATSVCNDVVAFSDAWSSYLKTGTYPSDWTTVNFNFGVEAGIYGAPFGGDVSALESDVGNVQATTSTVKTMENQCKRLLG